MSAKKNNLHKPENLTDKGSAQRILHIGGSIIAEQRKGGDLNFDFYLGGEFFLVSRGDVRNHPSRR